jgi:hypothetical protein
MTMCCVEAVTYTCYRLCALDRREAWKRLIMIMFVRHRNDSYRVIQIRESLRLYEMEAS